MSRKRETRRGVAEVRAVEVDGKPGVTLHCIRPGVVDDYGSVWMPDTFDASLARRMPVLCWSHNWNEPLGPAVDFQTSDDGPTVRFLFSDFDAVPQARRAHAQVLDGTITDCSVGFSNTRRRDPTDEERVAWPGVREVIEEADLDEVSLVLAGAVPGAKVLAVRSVGGTVSEDEWLTVARKVAAGDMTVAEGKAALELAAEVAEEEPPPTEEEPPPPEGETEPPVGDPGLDAEIEAALAVVTDRSH